MCNTIYCISSWAISLHYVEFLSDSVHFDGCSVHGVNSHSRNMNSGIPSPEHEFSRHIHLNAYATESITLLEFTIAMRGSR